MRAAYAAAAAVACLAAVALPARAATCVNVVVDTGSGTPTRHCTAASYGTTAAAVLAQRAKETGQPAPRYNGNFLCAIDGYPESGCGDHGTEPYWSFWIWVNGAWTYSSSGVDAYAVEDADHDGRPDPLGFRYTPFESKQRPRAAGAPPAPQRTTPPPAPHPAPTPPAPDPATSAPGVRPGSSQGAGAPGVHFVTSPPAATTAGPGSAAPGAATPSGAASDGAAPAPDAVEPTVAAGARRHRGLPLGTVAAGAVASALLGAAAYKTRRT
jgi:hypothetical protein